MLFLNIMKSEFNFKTLFTSFLNAFNVHQGFIPTIKDLLINPKDVIQFYIEGKTDKYGYTKYFSPGRFFVTILAILSIFTFFSANIDIEENIIRELTLRDTGYPVEEDPIFRKTCITRICISPALQIMMIWTNIIH